MQTGFTVPFFERGVAMTAHGLKSTEQVIMIEITFRFCDEKFYSCISLR